MKRSACYNVKKKYLQEKTDKDVIAPPWRSICKTWERSACYNVEKKYSQEKTDKDVIASHDVVYVRHESVVHVTM